MSLILILLVTLDGRKVGFNCEYRLLKKRVDGSGDSELPAYRFS